MGRVFIGVGSNIDARKSVFGALKLLGTRVCVVAVSTFYSTEPVRGAADSPVVPEYINGVIEVRTGLSPVELKFGLLRPVEETFGRVRSENRFMPRTIDLDLLLYGDTVMKEEGVELPDPDIAVRPFIFLPLFELCPGLELPGTGIKVAGLVAKREQGAQAYGSGGAGGRMEELVDFTAGLRAELGL